MIDQIKTKIRHSFTKNACRYDLYASVQREIASILLKRSHPFISSGGIILDLGCGTGFITLPLLRMGIKGTGIDLSSGMIDVLKEKTKSEGLSYYLLSVADGGYLPFKDNTFDLVISNLMYQWIWSLEKGFLEVSRIIREGGHFSFTLLGEKSLKELKAVYSETTRLGRNGLPPLINFPYVDSVKETLKKLAFKDVEVDNILLTRHYLNLFHLLRSLKNIGATNPFDGKDKSFNKKSTLEIMERIYQERFAENGKVKATYEIIFCSGRK